MSRLARDALTIFAGRGAIRVAQLLAFVVLARALTTAQFGWFGVLTTAIALATTLGSLGLRQSFAFEIGQNRMTPGRALGTGLAIWPLLAAIAATVVFLAYGRNIEGIDPSVAAYFIFAGVAGAILHTIVQGIFLGRGNIGGFSWSEVIPRVLLALGVVTGAVLTSLTLTDVMWIQALSLIISLPFLIYFALPRGTRLTVSFKRLSKVIRYGSLFALNLFLMLLCTRISLLIVERLAGPDAAGQFFAAARVNEIVLEAAIAVGGVLFSRAVRGSDAQAAIRRGAEVAAWLFWTFLMLAVLVIIAAPMALELLVGEQYSEAGSVLQILALGLAPAAANKVIYSSIAGTGNPLFGTQVIVTAVALSGALALGLVPSLGVSGGAIAVVAGQYWLFAGYALTCRVRFGVPIRTFFRIRVGDLRRLNVGSALGRRKSGGAREANGEK